MDFIKLKFISYNYTIDSDNIAFFIFKINTSIFKENNREKNKKLFKNLVGFRFFYTLGYILSPLVILFAINNSTFINTETEKIVYLLKKISSIWIIVSFSVLLNKLLNAVNTTYKKMIFL